MLTKITLIIALCSNLSTQQIQAKMHALETQNPNTKISLRLDQKAQCTPTGEIIPSKAKRLAKN